MRISRPPVQTSNTTILILVITAPFGAKMFRQKGDSKCTLRGVGCLRRAEAVL